jgi:hypothetical protein
MLKYLCGVFAEPSCMLSQPFPVVLFKPAVKEKHVHIVHCWHSASQLQPNL